MVVLVANTSAVACPRIRAVGRFVRRAEPCRSGPRPEAVALAALGRTAIPGIPNAEAVALATGTVSWVEREIDGAAASATALMGGTSNVELRWRPGTGATAEAPATGAVTLILGTGAAPEAVALAGGGSTTVAPAVPSVGAGAEAVAEATGAMTVI